MTRNVYLGGNIAGPIPAPNRDEFERSASVLWAAVRTTDFPARAKLLAREVKQTRPDVIGLQEVALWRRGPAGVKDAADTAGHRGLRLPGDAACAARVALPARVGADGGRPRSADQRRLRRTADDARRGARARAQGPAGPPQARRTTTRRRSTVPTAIGTLTLAPRLDGGRPLARGRRFRVVNTHLEAFSDDHRLGQARELVAGPLRKARDRDPHRRRQLRSDRAPRARTRPPTVLHRRRAEGHLALAARGAGLLLLLQDRDGHGPAAGAVRPSRRPRLRQGQAARAARPRGRQRSRPTAPRRACGRPTTAAR